jgi:hypothetical protein
MARAPNIYNTNPYPVDPAFALIGQNLGTALFGDPEMAAQAKLRRAQAEAQAATAGYDIERTRGERNINDARERWSMFGPSGAIFQGNPGDATPEALARGLAGLELLAAAGAQVPGVMPQSSVGMVAGIPGLGESADTVAAPPPRVIDETSARLLGAILGNAPTVTTAYTEKQGDDYQAAGLENQFKMNEADNQTSIQNNREDNAAADRRVFLRRGGGGDGPGTRPEPAPKLEKPAKPANVSSSVLTSISERISAMRPDLQELGPAAYNAAVRRATEIYQVTGNPVAAADRAISEVVGERRSRGGFLGMGSKLEYFPKPAQTSSDF